MLVSVCSPRVRRVACRYGSSSPELYAGGTGGSGRPTCSRSMRVPSGAWTSPPNCHRSRRITPLRGGRDNATCGARQRL